MTLFHCVVYILDFIPTLHLFVSICIGHIMGFFYDIALITKILPNYICLFANFPRGLRHYDQRIGP